MNYEVIMSQEYIFPSFMLYVCTSMHKEHIGRNLAGKELSSWKKVTCSDLIMF